MRSKSRENGVHKPVSPLAEGRHLGFESVCTLVASAAGFSDRDANAGWRAPDADDGLEEAGGSFSFSSNASRRLSSTFRTR